MSMTPVIPALCPTLPRRVHLLGAGGAGLSGAARILVGRGHQVSGQDRAESEFSRGLREIGVEVQNEGDVPGLPAGVELVARSAAVDDRHPLVLEAASRGVPVLKYGDLLARLVPEGLGIGVAGTHGKTSTSWMLYEALRAVAQVASSPGAGALVGGVHRERMTNAVAPEPGGLFVFEACEYDRTFLLPEPVAAIITNVEADHLDVYETLDAVEAAFAAFASKLPSSGLLVASSDVPERVLQAAGCRVWRLQRELDLRFTGEHAGCSRFVIAGSSFEAPEITLSVPGEFNAVNAALAIACAVGQYAGHSVDTSLLAKAAAEAVAGFSGTARRFEPWGEVSGVPVVHDYAHHPTEIRATLLAARRVFPLRKLHVLFQPHQVSRTARFLEGFAEELARADHVVVAGIYGARTQTDEWSVGADDLARVVCEAGGKALAVQDVSAAADEVLASLDPEGQPVILVLGAGDVDAVKEELLGGLAVLGSR